MDIKLKKNNRLPVPQVPVKGLPDWKQPRLTDEAWEAAKKFLVETTPQGTATFAGISEKGKTQVVNNGACHKHMEDMATDRRYAMATTNSGAANELHKPFLSWLLYHSPYGEFILNREDFDFCHKHGFILAGSTPHTLFQNTLITTRHFKECCSSAFRLFNRLVLEEKIDGLIAYTICFLSQISYNGYAENSPFAAYSGHRASKAFVLKELLNVYRGNYGVEVGDPYTKKPTVNGGKTLWMRTPKPDINANYQAATDWEKDNLGTAMENNDQGIIRAVKAYRGETVNDAKIYHPPNPFKRSPIGSAYDPEKRFTNKEAVEAVAPYLNSEVKKELGITDE